MRSRVTPLVRIFVLYWVSLSLHRQEASGPTRREIPELANRRSHRPPALSCASFRSALLSRQLLEPFLQDLQLVRFYC